MQDSPSNNFCTLNPLDLSWNYPTGQPVGPPTVSQGNLKASMPDAQGYRLARGTMAVASGKWYFEMLLQATGDSSDSHNSFGISTPASNAIRYWPGENDTVWQFQNDGYTRHGEGSTGPYSTWTTGDVMSCAFDCDGGKIWLAKNGTWQISGDPAAGTNAMYSDLVTLIARDGGVMPHSGMYKNNAIEVFNFGQDSSFAGQIEAQGYQDDNEKGDFTYMPPTGFLALCSDNLPTPSIALPKENFNLVQWTGDDASPSPTRVVGFQPDMVWIKNTSSALYAWNNYDVLRGVQKLLVLNSTAAEATNAQGSVSYTHLTLPTNREV